MNTVQVTTPERLWLPPTRKQEGGTYFDDELTPQEVLAKQKAAEVVELLTHLNTRPDHIVYVGSTKEREQMRDVFNWWRREGALGHHPTIKIDWGIMDGSIRVGD